MRLLAGDHGAGTYLYSQCIKVSNGAKIRNRYNQVPHLTQDTNGKVTNSKYPFRGFHSTKGLTKKQLKMYSLFMNWGLLHV